MTVIELTRDVDTSIGHLQAGVVASLIYVNETRDKDGVLRVLVRVNRDFTSIPADAYRQVWGPEEAS